MVRGEREFGGAVDAAAGDGVKIIGRWHDLAARAGVVILESNDIAAVQRYAGQWNQL
jgi:hypothetical protein